MSYNITWCEHHHAHLHRSPKSPRRTAAESEVQVNCSGTVSRVIVSKRVVRFRRRVAWRNLWTGLRNAGLNGKELKNTGLLYWALETWYWLEDSDANVLDLKGISPISLIFFLFGSNIKTRILRILISKPFKLVWEKLSKFMEKSNWFSFC